MRFFVKAVATGFALSMGGAIFKKVSKKMGLDDDSTAKTPSVDDKACAGEMDPEAQPEA